VVIWQSKRDVSDSPVLQLLRDLPPFFLCAFMARSLGTTFLSVPSRVREEEGNRYEGETRRDQQYIRSNIMSG
jgi:hypothetical protein